MTIIDVDLDVKPENKQTQLIYVQTVGYGLSGPMLIVQIVKNGCDFSSEAYVLALKMNRMRQHSTYMLIYALIFA